MSRFSALLMLATAVNAWAKPPAIAPVLTKADQLQFENVEPGVGMAVLWGDPGKGAYGCMMKFDAQASIPPHVHVSEMKVIVVSGTLKFSMGDQAPVSVSAGSYVFIPPNMPHTSVCDSKESCTFLMEQPAKLQTRMLEQKK